MNDKINFPEHLEFIRKTVRGRNQRHRSRFSTSDVCQECAVQLLHELESKTLASPHAPPITKSWLKKMAMGAASKLRRFNEAEKRSLKKEVTGHFERLDGCMPPGEQVACDEITTSLIMATTRLTADQRQIIQLRYQQKLSFNEIGRLLSIHPKTVQREHQLALVDLKDQVSKLVD